MIKVNNISRPRPLFFPVFTTENTDYYQEEAGDSLAVNQADITRFERLFLNETAQEVVVDGVWFPEQEQ